MLVVIPNGAQAADRARPKDSQEAKQRAEDEAAKARKEREARVPEVVKEQARKKEEQAEQGPRVSVEDFRKKTELQVQKKREESLATLEQVIKTAKSDELAALPFQKAELIFDRLPVLFLPGHGEG